MEQQRAPFYLRRTKEAMVYFPERQSDGTWSARPVFTKRIPHTAAFAIDGAERELYDKITRFVRQQSRDAAARGDDPRAPRRRLPDVPVPAAPRFRAPTPPDGRSKTAPDAWKKA